MLRQNLIYNITKSQEWLVIILRFLSHSRVEGYISYAHLLTGSGNLGDHLEFCLLYLPPKAISSECKLHYVIPWFLIHSWIPITYKISIFFDRLNLSLGTLSYLSQDTGKMLSVWNKPIKSETWLDQQTRGTYNDLGSKYIISSVFGLYLIMGPIDTKKSPERKYCGSYGFFTPFKTQEWNNYTTYKHTLIFIKNK